MTTETATRVGTYEAMFLVSQAAAAQFGQVVEHINELLAKAGAEIIAFGKWDERRLAYEIDKQKRGIYFLVYFACPTDQITRLERDAQISEQILRLMVTTADHLTEEEMKVHDRRDELATEAKLRAEQAVEEDQSSGKVRVGRPELEEPPAPEAPSAETPVAETSGEPAQGS